MLSEKFNPKIDQGKRKKTFSKLNLEEVDVLHSSDDAEYLAKEFDRIFLKFLRLIKYSQDRNEQTKSEIDKDTHNLLKKFGNFVKSKAINLKIKNEQAYFFDDFCYFLNFLEGDSYFTKIHNSIPHTSLEDYNNLSMGKQFFNNAYGRERGFNKSCAGGSCSYWTVLLYNLFNKLKEAGIDMDIKIYRYKNLNDEIMNCPTKRHSGLIINFQGKDYIVDYEGISLINQGKIVKTLDSFLNACNNVLDENDKLTAEERNKIKKDKKVFENFKNGKQKETDKVIFFDNMDEFLEHMKIFPEEKTISLYIKVEDRVDPVKFNFIFTDTGVQVGVNGRWYDYILRDNNLSKKDFIRNFIKKFGIKRDINGPQRIDKNGIDDLEEFIGLIKDKINTEKLYQSYTSGKKWESGLVERDGVNKVIISQKS